MQAIHSVGSKASFWLSIILLFVMIQVPVQADPDPDGSPALIVDVRFKEGMETGNGYAFKGAKAVQYRAKNGEQYIRLDYTVSNNRSSDLTSHLWQVTVEGQSVGGMTVGKIPKGQSLRFSKMIWGKRINDIRQAAVSQIDFGSVTNSASTVCPVFVQTQARCETQRAAGEKACARSCMMREGSGGRMTACQRRDFKVGMVWCTNYTTVCDCDYTFGAVDPFTPELDALIGAPGRGGDPSPWYVKDLPL